MLYVCRFINLFVQAERKASSVKKLHPLVLSQCLYRRSLLFNSCNCCLSNIEATERCELFVESVLYINDFKALVSSEVYRM